MPKKSDKNIWRGLQTGAASALSVRDYGAASFAGRLATVGVEAGQIITSDRAELGGVWIRGVEIFQRTIHFQRHRGIFGELVRRDEGVLAELKLWPKQWAAARMFANSANHAVLYRRGQPSKCEQRGCRYPARRGARVAS